MWKDVKKNRFALPDRPEVAQTDRFDPEDFEFGLQVCGKRS